MIDFPSVLPRSIITVTWTCYQTTSSTRYHFFFWWVLFRLSFPDAFWLGKDRHTCSFTVLTAAFLKPGSVCAWGSTRVGIAFCLQIHPADGAEILTEDKMMRKECNGKCPVFASCRSNQNEEPRPPENNSRNRWFSDDLISKLYLKKITALFLYCEGALHYPVLPRLWSHQLNAGSSYYLLNKQLAIHNTSVL